MPKKPLLPIAFIALFLPAALEAQDADPVIYTLAVAGDTRFDPAYPTAAKSNQVHRSEVEAFLKARNRPDDGAYPWTFNYVQVRQTLEDLGSLPKELMPNRFMIMGDLVMGFKQGDGGKGLAQELEDFQWAMERAATRAASAPMVAVPKLFLPGNHEMTYKAYSQGKPASGVDLDDARAWDKWTGRLGQSNFNFNGPAKGDPAVETFQLALDQKDESFSFREADGKVHLVVINTDTPIQDPKGAFVPDLGRVPLAWLEEDLAKAQADPQVKTILVFGHKPAARPGNFNDKKKDEDTIHPASASAFTALLRKHGKVAAYICSHVHLFRADSLADPDKVTQRPVQIVVGNGGTSLESWWIPGTEKAPFTTKAPYFGFALVQVLASGEVRFRPYGRPAPVGKPVYAAYDGPEQAKAKPVMDWQRIQ
ncbi:MAG TPA: metallophosphoesterase [Holophaga sp.]|nr:metallophosphoesterase [Holophaga sp.]